ncbi:MAG: DUF192 domain-containing protein [Candidatus Paceibacterota bacterium]|jgi:hypothetical protein
MDKNKIYISFILIIIFFVFLFLISQKHNLEDIKGVKINGQDVKVDLALTTDAQAQGLSGRSGLKTNEGMFFIFSEFGSHPFWMKDMNFSIDIIWLDEDLRIVYIKRDARPESYPETYRSQIPSKYVLEVVSGFADKNNLKEGDRVEFTY